MTTTGQRLSGSPCSRWLLLRFKIATRRGEHREQESRQDAEDAENNQQLCESDPSCAESVAVGAPPETQSLRQFVDGHVVPPHRRLKVSRATGRRSRSDQSDSGSTLPAPPRFAAHRGPLYPTR